jgi:uncharacterized membrane protein
VDWDYWRRHPGRVSGLAAGMLFGILTVALGFWEAVFVFFCAGVGYLLAWHLEPYGGLYGFLTHILRRR